MSEIVSRFSWPFRVLLLLLVIVVTVTTAAWATSGATGYVLTELFQAPGSGCELASIAASPGTILLSGCASIPLPGPGAEAGEYCTKPTPNPEALGKVHVLNRVDGTPLHSIALEDYFGGSAWDGSHMWITRNEARTIAKIDISPGTGGVVSEIPLPFPNSTISGGLAFDGTHLLVQDSDPSGTTRINRVNPTTGQIESSILISAARVCAISDGESGFFGGENDDNLAPNSPPGLEPEAIVRLNPDTGEVQQRYILPDGYYPIDLEDAGPSSIFIAMLKDRDLRTPMFVYRMDFTSGIPTLSKQGLVVTAILLAATALWVFRRYRQELAVTA